ncbi:MAG: aminopeptidase [candidate division Zixibacteria bacterium]|nr:aminopeptidase [Candidatus Tariuqbacter arcticus]
MKDPRVKEFAEVLVNHSTKVKPGNKVLIEVFDTPHEVTLAIVEEVFAAGGIPLIEMKSNRVQRALYMSGDDDFFKLAADCELYRMKQMDCYIAVRGIWNDKEFVDIPGGQMSKFEKLWLKPVHFDERVANTRWVVTRFPSPSYAQKAKMSFEAFENFFFRACTGVDWEKMSNAMDKMVALMQKTDKVRLVAKGTDLTFSIKGIKPVKCAGQYNVPDGEIFTAPVRESVNGVIHYNTPSSYRGFTFENIELTFKDGKIVNAAANDTERINEIFDTDEGARYVGEFALGVNPYVDQPMDEVLFDEKISGSIHFTPGNAYIEADNGNKSSIHWDLVLIQTEEYGGGEIYFDDTLIRKDGVFIVDELKGLNPENLRA